MQQILLIGKAPGNRVIVTPAHPAESTLRAAQELQEYLCRMTSVRLPLEILVEGAKAAPGCICIGLHPQADLGTDGFWVRTQGESLLFDGGVRGVLYGVYNFLEYLGCRFWAPQAESIPQCSEIRVPQNYQVREVPVLEYRNAYWKNVTPENAAKLRLNSINECELPSRDGGGLHYCGFVHTLGDLAGMEKPYTDRQPCLTDETVFHTVCDNLRARLAADPTAAIASVSQNDSYPAGRGCQCAACRALDEAEGTPMGSLLPFVNRVAQAVEADYPALAIDTLAYRYTRKPPKTLHARDNVIMRLCSIECCFSHPIAECDFSTAEVEDGSFADTLRAWGAHSDRIYIWDYTTNFLNYNGPLPNFDVLRQNLRFFAENHVRGVFEQGNNQSTDGEFGALRCYLLAKLLWNPYMTETEYERHIREFLRGYYGAAGPALENYLARLRRAGKPVHFGIYFEDPALLFLDPDTDGEPRVRAEAFLRKSRMDFAAAKAAVQADALLFARVEKAEIQLDIYEWYVTKHVADDAIKERKDALMQTLAAQGQALYSKARKYGITHMHESVVKVDSLGDTPPDYTSSPNQWGK